MPRRKIPIPYCRESRDGVVKINNKLLWPFHVDSFIIYEPVICVESIFPVVYIKLLIVLVINVHRCEDSPRYPKKVGAREYDDNRFEDTVKVEEHQLNDNFSMIRKVVISHSFL